MDEMELQEILEDNYRTINFSKIPGVNKECIKEYMQKLLTLNIDFNEIDIEWLLSNTIDRVADTEIFDISLVDALVDRDTFEDYMSNDFGVVNPVIYELIYQAASQVESKLVTYESRQNYYSSQLVSFQDKLLNSTNESEIKDAQFGIEYYTELLEKINLNKSSKKR